MSDGHSIDAPPVYEEGVMRLIHDRVVVSVGGRSVFYPSADGAVRARPELLRGADVPVGVKAWSDTDVSVDLSVPVADGESHAR